MPSLESLQIILGFVCCIGILVVTLNRQRQFTHKDTGLFVGAFFAGFNIPVAIYLCLYYFTDDPPLAQTKLYPVAKYISGAGLALLFAACVSIWTFFQAAWKVEDKA